MHYIFYGSAVEPQFARGLKTALCLFLVHIGLDVFHGKEMNPESKYYGNKEVMTLLAIHDETTFFTSLSASETRLYLCCPRRDDTTAADQQLPITVQVSDSAETNIFSVISKFLSSQMGRGSVV